MTSFQYDPPPADWPMPETFSSKAEPEDQAVVAFFNGTNRDMLVFWYDPDGRVHSYGTISAKAYASLHTFKGHVWSFHDVEDGAFLWWTNKKTADTSNPKASSVSKATKAIENVKDTDPFVTIPSEIRTRNAPFPILLTRRVVMLSLAELTMKVIMNHCTDFDALPLPKQVKAELKKKVILLNFVREKAAASKEPVVAPRPPVRMELPPPPVRQERQILTGVRRRRHNPDRADNEETGEPAAQRRRLESPERSQEEGTGEPPARRRRRNSERPQDEESGEPAARRRRLHSPERPQGEETGEPATSRRRRHSPERSEEDQTDEPVARRRRLNSPEQPQGDETGEPTNSRRRRHSPEPSDDEETSQPPVQRRRLTTPDLYFS